jgi:hypothetical protein
MPGLMKPKGALYPTIAETGIGSMFFSSASLGRGSTPSGDEHAH